MNAAIVAARFGCTVEQARALYRKNAAQLRQIASDCERAAAKGKTKCSGYATTPEEVARLRAKADSFEAM